MTKRSVSGGTGSAMTGHRGGGVSSAALALLLALGGPVAAQSGTDRPAPTSGGGAAAGSPAASHAADTPDSAVPNAPRVALDEVDRDLDRVDDLIVQGETEAARREIGVAEQRLRAVQVEHGASLPQGFVPLIVVEERLAALRVQANGP